jgi:hypothetical protein
MSVIARDFLKTRRFQQLDLTFDINHVKILAEYFEISPGIYRYRCRFRRVELV